MTVEEIKKIISGPEYSFLRENEHLKNRIIFLVLGGSYAYGTNVEGSDVDVRGCAINSRSDILGLTNFEQVVNNETDTTVYSFNKLVQLLLNCNPNVIEMLGCKPEHYIMDSQIGREMRDHRKLFLSQRAVASFGGYANQQLRRLENAIARDKLPQGKREEYMKKSMENSVAAFEKKYTSFKCGSIRLYTDESEKDYLDREVFVDVDLRRFPAREFNSMINDMTNVIGTYEKLNGRNKKKDEAHLNKHAMHLIRLYLMCLDILEKEEIVTYREKDHDLLMEIRGGKYMNPDGTYMPEFFEMVNEYEKRMEYAKKNTSLPKAPDMKKVGEFVEDINEVALLIA